MVRMVNSDTFDSLSGCNSKREQFPQVIKEGSQRETTVSPAEAEGAFSQDEDAFLTMQTRVNLDETNVTSPQQAIEPTASRTEIQSNISNDENQEIVPPTRRSSVCCSVPLDRIKDFLEKINENCGNNVAIPLPAKEKSKERLLCLYCNRTFITSTLRQKHVDRFHLLRTQRRSSVRQQNRPIDSVCLYCDKFNDKSFTLKKLFYHLVTIHDAKYFGCLQCEIRFPNRITLEKHSIENHTQVEIPNEVVVENTDENSGGDDVIKNTNVKGKKRSVISSKVASKCVNRRLTRQQAKELNSTSRKNKEPPPKSSNSQKEVVLSKVKTKSYTNQVRQYPNIDFVFKYKKITDHSIDNIRIGSLTFKDVVFDKAFFNKVKCNIQENLLNYIDGKLSYDNVKLENTISSFELPLNSDQENSVSSEQMVLDVYLDSNVTPVTAILSSTLKEEVDVPSTEKNSRKKTSVKNDEVHYKYFTRRKYQAILSESREHRDLSKLDMWTQLAIKDRQSKIVNDQRTTKEKIEYAKSEEYRTKLQVEELDRILDQRAPYENLKEEALRSSVMLKLDGSHDEDYLERYLDVQAVLMNILDRVYEQVETSCNKEKFKKDSVTEKVPCRQNPEIPFYLNLERKKDPTTSVCSDVVQVLSDEVSTAGLVDLTGEWTRTKIYVCAACGLKIPSLKQLIDHKNLFHSNVWCQHYEFVGNQSELYHHLSIPGLGKVGRVESSLDDGKIWRRSEARVCSKCEKKTNCLGELHRHILECGGDESWAKERKKNKYRYGSKSRKKRKGLLKLIRFERKVRKPSDKRKLRRRLSGPRSKPSDAESIERMLANLPPKRTVRKIISLKDGLTRRRNKKLSKEAPVMSKTKKLSDNNARMQTENDKSEFSNEEQSTSSVVVLPGKLKKQNRVQRKKSSLIKTNKSVLGEQKTEIIDLASSKEILVENCNLGINGTSPNDSNISADKTGSSKVKSRVVSTKILKKVQNAKNDDLNEDDRKVVGDFKFKNCIKKTKVVCKKKISTSPNRNASNVVNFGQKLKKNKTTICPEKTKLPEKSSETNKEVSRRTLINKIFPNLKRKTKSANGLVTKKFKKSSIENPKPLAAAPKKPTRKTKRNVRKTNYDSNFIIGTSNQKSEPIVIPETPIISNNLELQKTLLSQVFFNTKEDLANCVSLNAEREIKDELEMGPTEGDTAPTSSPIDEIKGENDIKKSKDFQSTSNTLTETKQESSCDFKAKLSVTNSLCPTNNFSSSATVNNLIKKKEKSKTRDINDCIALLKSKLQAEQNSIDNNSFSVFTSFSPPKENVVCDEKRKANFYEINYSKPLEIKGKNECQMRKITDSENLSFKKLDDDEEKLSSSTFDNVEEKVEKTKIINKLQVDKTDELIVSASNQKDKPTAVVKRRTSQRKCKVVQATEEKIDENQLQEIINDDDVKKNDIVITANKIDKEKVMKRRTSRNKTYHQKSENLTTEKSILQSCLENLIKKSQWTLSENYLFPQPETSSDLNHSNNTQSLEISLQNTKVDSIVEGDRSSPNETLVQLESSANINPLDVPESENEINTEVSCDKYGDEVSVKPRRGVKKNFKTPKPIESYGSGDLNGKLNENSDMLVDNKPPSLSDVVDVVETCVDKSKCKKSRGRGRPRKNSRKCDLQIVNSLKSESGKTNSITTDIINAKVFSMEKKEELEEIESTSKFENDDFHVPTIELEVKNSKTDDIQIKNNSNTVPERSNTSLSAKYDDSLLNKKVSSDSEDDIPLAFIYKKNVEIAQNATEVNEFIKIKTEEFSKEVDNFDCVKSEIEEDIKREDNDVDYLPNFIEHKEVEADKENERIYESTIQQKPKIYKTKKRKRSEKTKIKISIINEETIDVISKLENHKHSEFDSKSEHLGKMEDSSKISISITSTNTLKPVQVQSDLDEVKEEYSEENINSSKFNGELETSSFKRKKNSATVLGDNLTKSNTNGTFDIESSSCKIKEKKKHMKKSKKNNKERTKTHLTISIKEAPYLNKIKICKKETRTEESSPDCPRITKNNLQLDFSNFESDYSSKNKYVISPIDSKRNSAENSDSENLSELIDSIVNNSINDDDDEIRDDKELTINSSFESNLSTENDDVNTDNVVKVNEEDPDKIFITHKNSETFSCDICQKSFRRSNSLTKHKRTLTHTAKLSKLENNCNIFELSKSPPDDHKFNAHLENISKVEILSKNIIENAREDIVDKFIKIPSRDSLLNYQEVVKTEPEEDQIVQNVKTTSTSTSLPSIKCSIFLTAKGNESLREKIDKVRSKSIGEIKEDFDEKERVNKTSNSFKKVSDSCFTLYKDLEDQSTRKVLNHDEELFLECCSLLKSGSEMSGSQKSSKKINFQCSPVRTEITKINNEPRELVKNINEEEYTSRDSDMEMDDSLDSLPNTTTSKIYERQILPVSRYNSNESLKEGETSTKNTGLNRSVKDENFEENFLRNFSFNNQMNNVISESETNSNIFQEEFENKELGINDDESQTYAEKIEESIDYDFRHKVVSKFGSLVSKALRNRYKIATDSTYKKKRQNLEPSNITQLENEKCDFTDAMKSTPKRVLTKGAMKTYEKLHFSSSENNDSSQKSSLESYEQITDQHDTTFKLENFNSNDSSMMERNKNDYLKHNDNSINFGGWSSASYDVYEFEETQDNCTYRKNPSSFKDFKTTKVENTDNKDDDDDDDVITSDLFQSSSENSKLKSNKIITKKKCKIMGKIFKNTCKSNAGSIKCISLDEDSEELPETCYEKKEEIPVCNKNDIKKCNKMTQEEMDKLFNKLVGIENPVEESKRTESKIEEESYDDVDSLNDKTMKKLPQKMRRNKRRKRNSQNSTDEEFNISRTCKKKKRKTQVTDSGINLEQEIKECIGVASRKSQRKCTSGKQNVLVEYWSSDESMTDVLIKKTIEESKLISENVKEEKLNKEIDCNIPYEPLDEVENSFLSFFQEKSNENTPEISCSNDSNSPHNSIEINTKNVDNLDENFVENKWENNRLSLNLEVSLLDDKQKQNRKTNHQTRKRMNRRRRNSKHVDDSKNVNKRVVRLHENAETIAKTRQKRTNVDTLYYWSSSSEDEQEVLEVKNHREELEHNEDRPLQHGWIVGDSPKKLVTMLAQAKGKKVDINCVKEQNRR